MSDARFQIMHDPRPDRNPMQLANCLPIPSSGRFLGPCGHPGCNRAADYVGLNRVCDFCGACDPECILFQCAECFEDA